MLGAAQHLFSFSYVIIGGFTDFERETLLERVHPGMAHARQRRMNLGRPQTAALKTAKVRQLHDHSISKAEFARALKIAVLPCHAS